MEPPAPPSFRQSASPYMHDLPSPPPPPAKPATTWSRPVPSTFVNGRGNVQPIAAPRSLLVSDPRASTTPLPRLGSQTSLSSDGKGQQTYRRATGTASPPSTLVDSSHISFPSPFGMRQRVALKRTSIGGTPVQFERTTDSQDLPLDSTVEEDSTAGDLRSSVASLPLSQRPFDPPRDSSRSSHTLPSASSSASNDTAPLRTPSVMSADPSNPLPKSERSVSGLATPFVLSTNDSPSPAARPAAQSVLSTSRQAVSTPTAAGKLESDGAAPPPLALAPSRDSMRSHQTSRETTSASMFAYNASPSSSTLSRPTPVPERVYDSSSRSHSPAPSSSSSFQVLERSQPKTPDSFSPTSSTAAHSYASSGSSHAPRPSTSSSFEGSKSVLDRPRPRTPESSHYFDTISNSTRSASPHPLSSSHASRPGRSVGSSSRYYGATDEPIRASYADSVAGRSSISSTSSPLHSLSLDLGIDESGSMFDLASLLRVGKPDSPVKQQRTGSVESQGEKKVPPRLDLSRGAAQRDESIREGATHEVEDEERTPMALRFPVDVTEDEGTSSSPPQSARLPLATKAPSLFSIPSAPASPLAVTLLEAPPSPTYSSHRSVASTSQHNATPEEFFPSSDSFSSMASSSSTTYELAPTASPSPVKRRPHFDKSLPPTPVASSPYAASTSTQESPTRTSALRRGLSKMMLGPGPASSGSQIFPPSSSSSRQTSQSNMKHESAPMSASPSASDSMLSSSSAAGKRFADRFGSGPTTMRTAGDEATDRCFPRRASGSLSSLNDEMGRPRVGMGVTGPRKSDSLLSSSEATAASPASAGRRSLDLLSQKQSSPRRASTDDLLNLATVKLAKLNGSTSTVDSASTLPQSPTSTSSLDHSPDKVAFSTATRVSRLEPATPPNHSPSSSVAYPGRQTATPVLFKVDLAEDARVAGSPSWRKRVKVPDSGVGSDCSLTSVWIDLEDALALYSAAVTTDQPDRGTVLTGTLLPFLRRETDTVGTTSDDHLARRQRQVLFGWLAILTTELKTRQPVHRGACLESLAGIAESRFMSTSALELDLDGQSQYRTAIVEIIAFAVDKLNDKAVYANTLVFSGRVFALAFFRIEGVAFMLLRALPAVKRQCLQRILVEAGVDEHQLPPVDVASFPAHLESLCLRDLRTYTTLLMPITPKPEMEHDRYLVRDGTIEVEMSGNWLIRWTASDSDLPFAFYRAYHRQLATYVVPPELRHDLDTTMPCAPDAVICAPGFLFLAASLLDKCDALVHRNLRSVTSIGPGNGANFNSNDSANLAVGQKPKVLELANRRLVSTMLDIVGGPPHSADAETAPDAEIRRHAFSGVLQVWIRACVKRTSMWDTRSVFILLDLIEGLIYTLSYPAPSNRGLNEAVIVPQPQESCLAMFDIGFIFSFVKTILAQADNTVAVMRTIAFVYAHFEIFTLRPADRTELCENIILDESLFPRLYLHWNAGVRGYFIRLLVWRLARLGIVASENRPTSTRDAGIVALFGLMNVRLEVIRRRHDELEPMDTLTDDDRYNPKRSTICSTKGVSDAPYVVAELVGRFDEDDEPEYEAQEVVRTTMSNSGRKGGKKEIVTIARVVSWIKGGLGRARNSSKARNVRGRIEPFVLDESPRDVHRTPEPSPPIDAAGSAWEFSPLALSEEERPSTPGSPSERQVSRPESPAFFSFEFEGGVAPRVNAYPSSPTASSTSSHDSYNTTMTSGSGDTVFPVSPTPQRTIDGLRQRPLSGVSARVSLRFSKRISILPPAALDVLKENGEPVPPIPDKYRVSMLQTGYAKGLHPYAVRGLRDYEDALSEWEDWVIRLQEDEDEGRERTQGFVDIVPRLSVAWPQVWDSTE